jgi:hypothetical protein
MWSTTEHFDEQDLLSAIDGELDPRRRAAFDAHATRCAACRARRDSLAATLSQISALFDSRPVPTTATTSYARVRLEGALREAAREERRSGIARFFAAMTLPSAPLAVGAAVVLLLGAWLVRAAVDPGPADRHVVNVSLPLSTLTPGAVSALTAAELCAGVRPSRLVPDVTRQHVLNVYGMQHVSHRTYELDALITPELGGTTEAANLWPQRYESPVWNARVKDELEELLPEMVCNGQLDLAAAQRAIASDWVAAYKHFFKTERPLQAHLGPAVEKDEELIFLPPERVVAAFIR